VVDLTADNLAHEAAAAFLFAKEARLEAEKREDAAKAELLDKLGAASVATLNGFTRARDDGCGGAGACRRAGRDHQRAAGLTGG
jgi:hypothetical protein